VGSLLTPSEELALEVEVGGQDLSFGDAPSTSPDRDPGRPDTGTLADIADEVDPDEPDEVTEAVDELLINWFDPPSLPPTP
jgi:hypothetical protein